MATAVATDSRAEETLVDYLVHSDDLGLIRVLYTVWRQYKDNELTTPTEYEEAYIDEWTEVIADHDRFKYYSLDVRDDALSRAATTQRELDDVSF